MSRSNNHNHLNRSSWHWPSRWHQDQEITGTDGSNWLFGGWGNDTITGGAGDDRLWGLHGDDLFVFDPGSGHDTIYGFRAGEGSDDVILLRDSGVEDFDALMTMAVWHRGATTFTLPDGSQIVVRGRRPDDFHPDDFRFEVTTPPLFTDAGEVVDFNLVLAGDYIDGTQYHGLDGNDEVTLANSAVAALAAGYVPGSLFDAGAGNDIVRGGAMDDNIAGGAGNDVIYAGTGHDSISGGAGDDRIYIDDLSPEDVIDGGDGTDTLVWVGDANQRNYFTYIDNTYPEPRILLASAPDGEVLGAPYTTVPVSGIENIDVTGGQYNDLFRTWQGDDVVRSLAGQDYVNVGTGRDWVEAGTGTDYVTFADVGGDYGDGGEGTDRLTLGGNGILHGALNLNMATGVATVAGAADSTFVNFEYLTVYGGFQGGTITGTDERNIITVRGTGFTIDAGQGYLDRITIYEGGNNLHGGGFGTYHTAVISTAEGVTLDVNAETYEVAGVTADITGFTYYYTSTGNDHITGSDINEVISTSTGTDYIDAGGGSDLIRLYVGGGDIIDGGAGQDRLAPLYTSAQNIAGVTVDMVNGEISDTSGILAHISNIEQVTGSGGDDLMLGSDVTERLDGGGGNDTIHTGGSVIHGYATYDMVYAGAGDDIIYIEATNANIDGGTGADTFIFVDDGSGATREIFIYDASRAEGDVIDLSDLGVTEADILAGYSELYGRHSVVEVGALTITMYNIDATEFGLNLFSL